MADSRSLRELREEFGRSRFLAVLADRADVPPAERGHPGRMMWVPFSWMLQHWIGVFHGLSRTVLIVGVWYLFRSHRFVAVPVVIIGVYLISILALATRRPHTATVAA